MWIIIWIELILSNRSPLQLMQYTVLEYEILSSVEYF